MFGIAAILFWEFPWNLLFPFLWVLYLLSLRRLPLLLLIGAGSLYGWYFYSELPSNSQPVSGIFSLSSLQPHSTPFTQGLLYKGILHLPSTSLPCSIFYRGNDPPKANCDYLVQGTLKQKGAYNYSLKAENWVPLPKTWSLAEMRFHAKKRFLSFLSENLPTPRTATFLCSLLTGESQDRLLRYEFGRLGLQHILAVSGFHFGILIAFSSFFLSFFLPRFWKFLLLLLAINAYFLFVGSNPAIQRSWLAAELYLLGKLLKRHASGLNLLGVALLFENILDPLSASNLGFQLSFASCAGILLFFQPAESQIAKALPKRSRSQIRALTPFAQLSYLFSSFLRKSSALTCSVNLALLPILLYHFHTFPLLSLFYNLFFPFFVSIALFLLLSSCIVHFLFAPLSTPLFHLTDFLTSRLLDLTSYPPFLLDYSLRTNSIPSWSIPLYLFALLAIAIQCQKDLLPFEVQK